jgi:dTDP-4-amino-4,6-dideoxygalactose transaminase
VLWEHCTPVFVDIDPQSLCMDPQQIEARIGPATSGILATHVFGYACDVDRIGAVAENHGLKVIYDGAHAFGVKLAGRSLFEFGDVSTLSFHATKLFHTVEGGAVVTKDAELARKMALFRSFGHIGEEFISPGINAKNSEFHAAMGLCNLPRVGSFIERRRTLAERYRGEIGALPLAIPEAPEGLEYNYSYFPVLFRNEAELLRTRGMLVDNGVNTRRYFYPSLNTLPYLKAAASCPVSEDVARRILCLPFHQELPLGEVDRICRIVREALAA